MYFFPFFQRMKEVAVMSLSDCVFALKLPLRQKESSQCSSLVSSELVTTTHWIRRVLFRAAAVCSIPRLRGPIRKPSPQHGAAGKGRPRRDPRPTVVLHEKSRNRTAAGHLFLAASVTAPCDPTHLQLPSSPLPPTRNSLLLFDSSPRPTSEATLVLCSEQKSHLFSPPVKWKRGKALTPNLALYWFLIRNQIIDVK